MGLPTTRHSSNAMILIYIHRQRNELLGVVELVYGVSVVDDGIEYTC